MSEQRRPSDDDKRPEREVEDMERRAEELEEKIDEVRGDWEAKKADDSVPGAKPDDEPGD